MTEEVNPAKVRAQGQLEIVEEALQYFAHRKAQIESALADIRRVEEEVNLANRFTFSAYPALDSGPGRFIRNKILEPIKAKHPEFEFRIIAKDDSIREIRWSKVDEKHNKEIQNACKWTEARAREKDAKP